MTALHQSPEVTAEALRILSETVNDRDRRIAELEAENRRLRALVDAGDDCIAWHAGGAA